MAYLFERLDFLTGGRLTSLSYMSLQQWPDELDHDIVLLGQYVSLPTGQHLYVEEDFLGSHLAYRRAMFGGRDPDDEPWLYSIQAVPCSVVTDVWGSHANPYDIMRSAMTNALTYNHDARVGSELEWNRTDLLDIYAEHNVDPQTVSRWTTFTLLRGLLAELTGAELRHIVAGYPDCAFPGQAHDCQHDIFDDLFTAWAASQRE